MDRVYEEFLRILKTGEPLVVAGLFCFILGIGFVLGSGLKKSHRIIHTKWKAKSERKAAQTKELLQ